MFTKTLSAVFTASILSLALGFGQSASADPPGGKPKLPIVLAEQGGFSFAGEVLGDPDLASLHCGHGYVEFQIPPNARELALLMVHSASTLTWETTFDGREGFKNIFLRRGFSSYVTDVPRIGRAGWGCVEWTYTPNIGNDQFQFTSWRFGTWTPPDPPEFFPGVQFPTDDPEALAQMFRGRYPEFENPGAWEADTDALATLLDESIGPAVVVTHSGSGIRGWLTAIKSENAKAVVAYEPVQFVFPVGEVPPPNPPDILAGFGLFPLEVSLAEFELLTEIPIQIVFGDNIPTEVTGLLGRDIWLEAKANAEDFVAAINAHGGDAELLNLPDVGLFGNTHIIMGDLNNVEVADLLSEFLKEKGLDTR
jgi:hypothetical protein